MRASTWLQVLGYTGNLTHLVERFRSLGSLDPISTWYYDQRITTYAILKSGLCTVPEKSGLWNMPGLQYAEIDDNATCFHGKGYRDCNKDIHIVYQGCKWYHFYPNEKFDAHLEKFRELTNNEIKLEIQTLT
ncbi:uncharacterized protein LOC111700876 [Eurytemora carolleeae]|uniref:uncharacterized protein LOC111700876 n=1 Tax=Eurytemora carolleeae TaxID=1294199 RepID=UPI000C75D75A|nr:uncharacterized protein LOC111700876 [Eurytemora carolleeae]|eukprot:XP_023327709.1 uncharacterized protein LOC111700876 [Eurytemora affinis]